MKAGHGAHKGSQFERSFCSLLSQWYTREKLDDVFYRTAGSGGRATVRRKKGTTTAGGAGDIQALNPVGGPLMELLTFELKRGYNKVNIQDLIDRPDRMAQCPLEDWVRQAQDSAEGHSLYWMIVHKRDQREPILLFPSDFTRWLKDLNITNPFHWRPFFRINCHFRKGSKSDTKEFLEVDGTTLSTFFRECPPTIAEKVKHG